MRSKMKLTYFGEALAKELMSKVVILTCEGFEGSKLVDQFCLACFLEDLEITIKKVNSSIQFRPV